MSLAAQLWRESAGEAGRILAHPFVQGLGNGGLPLASFRTYVAQDAFFLEGFARAYAFCLAHTTDRAGLDGFASLIAGVVDELRLHAGYAKRWGVSLAGVVTQPATRAYVDFLLGIARGGDIGETAAAMAPCMRLYAFLGQELARGPVAPAYAEWVRTYADPGFEGLALRLEELLDRAPVDPTRARAHYRRAMALEYGFFDACL
ncbi:MAG: TenA family protein [Alphaproteobacteria bacterium]|nr:TenA family protein [Alphaproteobacteria bacterium]